MHSYPAATLHGCGRTTGVLLACVAFVAACACRAAESECARVKIEIRQELTLERQAFDAGMRINNGLTDIALAGVNVDVTFTDESGQPVVASSDPNNTEALFFIRVDSMNNIADVSGAGTVAPGATAEIHWLIIPAPGASNGLESGALYFVGAVLTYTTGGQETRIEVSPDYIFVKPVPELMLDYFLPAEVYGDDAFTPAVEPPVPFGLGVRAKNVGAGTAYQLRIESAQPQIVDNEQGLLISFVIESVEVNGTPAAESLRADLGDIPANESAVARWVMTCSLSGEFVAFDADFAHADELGGELTSLIQEVNTHFLVRDVLVDLPGRDGVRDFLALDGDVLRVYESSGLDTEAADQSGSAAVVVQRRGTRVDAELTFPLTAGPAYVKLQDPFSGGRVIVGARRSDGKAMALDNVWLSKTRKADNSWEYFVNLFDVNTPGRYIIMFADPVDIPQPPVIEYIPDRSRAEGEQLSFLVVASDPNQTIPVLATGTLPVGAGFVDRGDGTGIFDWTPEVGQAGEYAATFTACDGEYTASRSCRFTIYGDERFEIAVEGGEEPVLTFGMVAGATDSYDPGLDQDFGRGGAGRGVSAWFENTDWDDPQHRRLVTDLRAVGRLHRWRLRVDLEDGRAETMLSWDLGRLDSRKWMLLQRLDREMAVGPAIDMRDTDSLSVTAGGSWEICYGEPETESFEVDQGWNMVGTALMTDTACEALFASERRQRSAAGQFYTWNADQSKLAPVINLCPEIGLWHYSAEAAMSAEFSGLPADGRITLRAGWNLVSPAIDCPAPANAWLWCPGKGTYTRVAPGEVLHPGIGYWLYDPEGSTVVDPR